jgi:hypothetical protein
MKYQALIKKIQTLKASQLYANTNWNFNRSELALIEDALETIQALFSVIPLLMEWNLN